MVVVPVTRMSLPWEVMLKKQKLQDLYEKNLLGLLKVEWEIKVNLHVNEWEREVVNLERVTRVKVKVENLQGE